MPSIKLGGKKGDTMQIIDLEELKPEIRAVKLKTMSGDEHIIPIIYNAGVMIVQQKYKDKLVKLDIETVSACAMSTFDYMTVQWFNDNVGHDDIGNMYMFIMHNFQYSREKAQKISFLQDEKKKKRKSFLARFFLR